MMKPVELATRHRRPRVMRVVIGGSLLGMALFGAAFCGADQPKQPLRSQVVMHGGVRWKTNKWADPDRPDGVPQPRLVQFRKQKRAEVDNLDEDYYIIFARSKIIRKWHPINIISGQEAAKNIKKATDNVVAKTVGFDEFANSKLIDELAKSIYKNKDEVWEQATKFHPTLKYCTNYEFGYKLIEDNEKFNEDPGSALNGMNITAFKSEAELRSVVDDASDTLKSTQESVTKVSDNIKGFLGNFGR